MNTKLKALWAFLVAAVVAITLNLAPSHRATPLGAGAGVQPIIPQSWTVAAWFVDPANVTTTASDSNDCQTNTTPCLTWHEINDHRWGCLGSPGNCPRLRQNTTITFLSSQSGNSDQIYFKPALENAAYGLLSGNIGAAQQIQTGTLGTVTPKNRATPQLLNAILGAGLAAGQLIVNSTHSSRAWLYKNVTGNTWSISQPMVPVTFPAVTNPAEVDTWTAGDTYTVYQPLSVVITDIGGTSSGAINNGVQINSLNFLAPVSNDMMQIDASSVVITECSNNRFLSFKPTNLPFNSALVNVYANTAFRGSAGYSAALLVNGGLTTVSTITTPNTAFGEDFIVGGNLQVFGIGFNSTASTIYIDTGAQLRFRGEGDFRLISTPIVWGPGSLDVGGTTRLNYTGNTATSTFLLTGAMTANGSTTACSLVLGTGVWACGITINPTNLDAAAGAAGFGGNAMSPGGSSITSNGI